MKLTNAQGQPLTIGQEIGQGGEATIHQVRERPGLLAKIYHKPARPSYKEKLAWMQANPPHDPTLAYGHASIAWPLDMVLNRQGQLAGYLMPRIRNASSLLEVFNPRRRAETLPDFNQKYLYRTARNLASALAALHAAGYVVGDLNESNIMVTPSALVTLIDTDSFQITARIEDKDLVYPCPVGKAEYTPPELQGHSFTDTYRRPEHDAFGLAVLTFQLLMQGNHPFRAQWLGVGEPPPLEERIRAGCYPYLDSPPCPVAPPRHSPAIDSLPPRLVQLFRQCFVAGQTAPTQRPTAALWAKTVAEAENSLVNCPDNHFYAQHLPACPDCAKQRRRSTTSTGSLPLIQPIATRGQPARHSTALAPTTVVRPITFGPKATTPPAATRPDQFTEISKLAWIVLLVIIVLFGAGGLALWDNSRTNSATVIVPAPPAITITPLPTSVHLVRVTLARVTLPTKTPTLTAVPQMIHTLPPTDTPLPTLTPVPVTPAPPLPPTETPVPAEPQIFIILPDGDAYNRGDTVKVILSLQDQNGVGNVFYWVTGEGNNNVLLRKNFFCGYAVDCLLTESFSDLPRGNFTIYVAAFDGLDNSTLQEAVLSVR